MRVPSETPLCFHLRLGADRLTLQRFVRTFLFSFFQVIELRMAFVPEFRTQRLHWSGHPSRSRSQGAGRILGHGKVA